MEVAAGAAVAITFDDGNCSDVERALPALAERDLTATFHVCAGRLDLPGYLDGSAVQHLRSSGMSIGSHGWDHVDLRALSDPDLVRAAQDSRQRLGEVCGEAVTSFAVPLGSYDRRVLRHLRHYRAVCHERRYVLGRLRLDRAALVVRPGVGRRPGQVVGTRRGGASAPVASAGVDGGEAPALTRERWCTAPAIPKKRNVRPATCRKLSASKVA